MWLLALAIAVLGFPNGSNRSKGDARTLSNPGLSERTGLRPNMVCTAATSFRCMSRRSLIRDCDPSFLNTETRTQLVKSGPIQRAEHYPLVNEQGTTDSSACQEKVDFSERLVGWRAPRSGPEGVDDDAVDDGARRVGVWRGGFRLSMSVAAPFVWRCLSGSTVAPFPHPPHRTGQADFLHPALGQDLTPSSTARRAQAGSDVRARSARRGARVDSSRPFAA